MALITQILAKIYFTLKIFCFNRVTIASFRTVFYGPDRKRKIQTQSYIPVHLSEIC